VSLTLTIVDQESGVALDSRTFERGRFAIGREPYNDWSLPDPERVISRQHCIIEGDGEAFQLRDCSINGVFIDGAEGRVRVGGTVDLHDGDQLEIGRYTIKVQITAIASVPKPRESDLLTALLSGAGLEGVNVPAAQSITVMRTVGQLLRTTIDGLIEAGASQRSIQREIRIATTDFENVAGNPLKTSAKPRDALIELLLSSGNDPLQSAKAVAEAFGDIREHERALVTAIQDAARDLLDKLDPDVLEQHPVSSQHMRFWQSSEARNWDTFRATYKAIVPDGFKQRFARAYQKQIRAGLPSKDLEPGWGADESDFLSDATIVSRGETAPVNEATEGSAKQVPADRPMEVPASPQPLSAPLEQEPDARSEETADVRFTVYHPREVRPEVWATLLVFVHIPKANDAIEAHVARRLHDPDFHRQLHTDAKSPISRGAEVSVVPYLPGFRFNPPFAQVLWLEDWHCVEFRLQPLAHLSDSEAGRVVNGRVSFYVSTLLVGEVPIWCCISDDVFSTAVRPDTMAQASPYQAIFASYAHEDADIVERLKVAYNVLGMDFLRDVDELRSGEAWEPALLAMIERADIFQLYWSDAASRSQAVKREWDYALKQDKRNFLRPVYWKAPMPHPPKALHHLHFAYCKI
jgi:predicted component of type VI protein secretion system